jgi:prepilin-type N-terminal cleavage/methylation domain-containing protein/prepilin-type processing-associated H-X9-DG protein
VPLRRGISLPEVLVVIAIVAVLIALLLPAVSSVRERGRTTACLSNLRQLGVAAQSYTQDNNGHVVPAWVRSVDQTQTLENWATLLVATGAITAPVLPSADSPPEHAPTVLRCPSGLDERLNIDTAENDPTSPTDARGATCWRERSGALGGFVDVWYGINAATQAGFDPVADALTLPTCRLPRGLPPSLDYRLTRLASIARPSELVFLFDGVFLNHTITNPNRVNARHDRLTRTNLLFFDGHVETRLRSELPIQKTDYTLTELAARFPQVKWRVDQR